MNNSTTSSSSNNSSTYEATKARQSTARHADQIHWDASVAFRDEPYRLLHHQNGVIGMFRIRLLEAADLKRSYWSALALGPVKHLGLSKAHGAVSSCCTFSLEYTESYTNANSSTYSGSGGSSSNRSLRGLSHYNQHHQDRKPAARISKNHNSCSSTATQPAVVSPVIPNDSNPVWENCQFDFPFRKGAMPSDGMRVNLRVRVDEDATAVENFLPGIPSSGERLLGMGQHDLTELCFGETDATGQPLPGVRDCWIPISLQGQEAPELEVEEGYYSKDDPLAPIVPKKKAPEPPSITGMVRVLVSYQPVGLDPQPKDIIALESFARRDPAISSCRPLLAGLQPLTVVDRKGSYLLAQSTLADGRTTCVRLHRNTVFVVERQNMVDAAHNLALLPVDVMLSTPIGQGVADIAAPLVAASREVMMPALLSFKLLWMAARTTTLAGMSGVQAVWTTFWQEGSNSLTGGHGNHHTRDGVHPSQQRAARRNERRDGGMGTAQFVSL